VYYVDPKVAVAVIVPREGGIVLGRRAIDPGLGAWSFPSGYVDRGEVLEEAAAREVLEEIGLEVAIENLVGLYSTAGDPVILAVYSARVIEGALRPGPEMSEVAIFPTDKLPPMAFSHDARIIADWQRLRACGARGAP
jgi:ADP-ribose pyrophosphatase YjhB (NUDIX family)